MAEHEWTMVIERYICDGCGEDWNDGRCTCEESPGIQPVKFVPKEEAEAAIEK